MLSGAEDGSKIIVTGAAGFVGRWFLRELCRARYRLDLVVATHRGDGDFSEFEKAGLVSRVLDIEDGDAVDLMIRETAPTAIVHLAAIAAPGEARSNPRRAWDVNVFGTINLASAVLRHAPEAAFLFVGSSEVYGASFSSVAGGIGEEAPLNPLNLYGATKAAADIAIGQMARDGLRALRFRPFNHTGPGQSPRYVIPSFAEQVVRIEAGMQPPVMVVGRLDGKKDFLDVRDVVRAYRLALEIDPRLMVGQALNLASGRPMRIGSILERLIATTTVEIDVRQDPARMRSNESPVTSGDGRAALELLGWTPAIPFDASLADMLDHFRAKDALDLPRESEKLV